MPHALWKGTINFGLVAMPIEMLVADDTQSLDLDMLDSRDNAPIKFKRFNSVTNKEVQWKDIVKGYKTKGGDYVIITDEDFKRANVKATQSIDIQSFVDVKEVDVAYFEKPYYLKPAKGGDKPYALLYKTLMDTKKAGIATVVLRTKQHLAAVLPKDGNLILEIMRFPNEIRDKKKMGVTPVRTKISAREAKMAKDLVASMSTSWNPKEYHDTYHEDLLKMIKHKIKHGDTESIPQEAEEAVDDGGKVLDLMPLLRKSLEQAKPHARKTAKKKATTKKKAVKRGSSKVS